MKPTVRRIFPLSDSVIAVLATVMQLRSDTDLSLGHVPNRIATDLDEYC